MRACGNKNPVSVAQHKDNEIYNPKNLLVNPLTLKPLLATVFCNSCCHLKVYKLSLIFLIMELNKNLEYRICFDKVGNLDKIKKNGNYFGSVEVDGNLYAITVDENSKKKELAKEMIPYATSSFKKIYSQDLKSGRPPINHLEIEMEKSKESPCSEN